MNDTVHLWRDVLNCTMPKYPSKPGQAAGTLSVAITVILLTLLFYIGNYVQGERLMKEFMKCKNVITSTFGQQVMLLSDSQSNDPRQLREGSMVSFGGVQNVNRIHALSPEELTVSDLYATQNNGPTLQTARLQTQRITEAEEDISEAGSNPATVHF